MKKSFIALALFSAFSVQAEVVQDLSGWQTDGSSGNWTYNAESNSWYQSENTATGTFLYDPSADALGKAVEGSIKVSGGDDDWIGFALGYDAGDVDSPDSDYLLLTWKKATQGGMLIGMDMWHITGSLGASSLFSPYSHPSMTHVANASTLADTGWATGVDYTFSLTYEKSGVGVFVNDNLEFALTPGDVGLSQFQGGSFAFFNYSQGGVTYDGVKFDSVEAVISEEQREQIAAEVPLQGGAAAMLLAGAVGFSRKKRANT